MTERFAQIPTNRSISLQDKIRTKSLPHARLFYFLLKLKSESNIPGVAEHGIYCRSIEQAA